MVLSYAAGLQVITVSCSLPTATTTTTTTKKRCRHCRRRRRRVRDATTTGASTVPPSSTDVAAPAFATFAASVGEHISTPLSPEVNTPPAKRKRRRSNEVELLRGLEEEGELLLSPLSWTASPLLSSLSPPSSPRPHASATTLLPLSSPAPPEHMPLLPPAGPPSLPNYWSRLPKWR
jgi:hypothetical protein